MHRTALRLAPLFVMVLILFAPQRLVADPVQRALDATLTVLSDAPERQVIGSGFVWSERWGLTNAHVVGEANWVRVRRRDGSEHRARVYARDASRDIALLQLPFETPGLPRAPRSPAIGAPVLALGAPMGVGFSVTRGIVSADPRQVDPTVPLRLLQHDAAINPGSSGGPLIDMDGRLIGMNSQIADGSRLYIGISYAIAVEDVSRLVDGLRTGALVPVPELGLYLRPVTPRIAAALGIAKTGLLVDDILPGLAGDAGVRPGDVLLRLHGHDLTDPGALSFALDGARGRLRLQVLRGGEVIGLHLPTRPPAGPAMMRMPKPPAPRPMGVMLDGAVVADLDEDGIAALGGLVEGDRILTVNGAPVPAQLSADAGPLVLLVEREGRHLHLILDRRTPLPRLRPAIGGNALDLDVRRF